MSSSGKLVLCLAVLLCVLQAIAARPRSEVSFAQSVKYDLMKKCAGLQNDFDKDIMKLKQKLIKDAAKMLKKAVKADSVECIESARSEAEGQLQEKGEDIRSCIDELRGSLDTSLSTESTLAEINMFKLNFKNGLQLCKNSGKMDLKTVQNNFSVDAKSCLI